MFINAKNYSDFLSEIRNIGGEFAWIRKNNLGNLQNAGRPSKAIAAAIFASERIKRIFSHIWFNSEGLDKISQISYDRSVPVVWLPTHKSYLDFLLISLLCYHHKIQLPAICAAEDFQSSKVLGGALRRCGAFFIRRKFKEDPLYWAIFAEYVQQHLLHSDRPLEFFIEGQRSRTGKALFPRTGLLQLVVEPFLKAQVYDTLFVPITINYDRILEESLFAYELLGQPKPKENTSGLFKARQILSDSFGDIFVTIGDPISLREYLNFGHINLGFRCGLMENIDQSTYDKNLSEMSKKLAYRILADQNTNNDIQIANIRRESDQELYKITIAELNSFVEILVGIYKKCLDGKEIYQKGLTIYDAIMYCFI
uniref:PlsC domain-containing protein n=1 Tax=Meloidogyne hapla TaxID=6305 RepID=A0A1I8BCX3_MELHA